jgi:hypothetical protein
MSRIDWKPLGIALAAIPLLLLVLEARRHLAADSPAWWVLGPAPNLIVALCIPFAVVATPGRTPLESARAFTLTTLATFGALVVLEAIGPIPRFDTFDPLDLIASALGVLLGARLYRRLAPHLRYLAHLRAERGTQDPPPT